MPLKLYMHPLSSYCHKALMAFYENDIPFESMRIDDLAAGAEFQALWPVARFPILRDDDRGETVFESSIIIEYLGRHYPSKVKLIPEDPDLARTVRMWDRILDNYLHASVQKLAFDQGRPEGTHDQYGIEEARRMFRTVLDVIEAHMATRTWAVGDAFTLADCAAAPPLFYGNMIVLAFRRTHPNAAAYLDRLMARPSYARALKEAEPYMSMVPVGLRAG